MAEKRLIDANALLKEIEDWHDSLGGTMNPADWGIQNVLQSVMDYIYEAEDIDAVEVVHGRWKDTPIGVIMLMRAVCRNCGKRCMRHRRCLMRGLMRRKVRNDETLL